jgi:hypothetical protein
MNPMRTNDFNTVQIPQHLTAWSAGNATLAAVFSSDSTNITTRKLYYIGTDRELHELGSTNSSTELTAWSATPSQASDIWPIADVPNANFAATSAGGPITSIFYISNGSLVQVVSENGKWQKANTIFENLSPITSSSSSQTSTATATDSSSSKSSHNAVKIGAGVGVGIGVLLLAALGIGAWLYSRRGNKIDPSAPPVPEKDQYAYEKQSHPIVEIGYQEHELP